MISHVVYCLSNASTDYFTSNTLTDFTNFLPKNLEINRDNWEIGILAYGIDLNIFKYKYKP